MTVEMNIFRVAKQQDTESEVEEIDLIQTLTKDYFEKEFMRRTMEENQDFEEIREAEGITRESERSMSQWMPSSEPLGNLDSKLTSSVSHSSTPENKPLPSDLKFHGQTSHSFRAHLGEWR